MFRPFAFLLALLSGAAGALAASRAEAEEAQAIAALRSLAADPAAASPDLFADYDHVEAAYLLDGLSGGQVAHLRRHIEAGALTMPASFDDVLRARPCRAADAIVG